MKDANSNHINSRPIDNRQSSRTGDENKKEEKKKFYGPTDLEKAIDYAVIQYALDNGIQDQELLLGAMSLESCNILN